MSMPFFHHLLRQLGNQSCLLIVFWIGCCLPSFCSGQEIHWYDDLDTAKQVAQAENRMVLIHFTADWCRPCKTLERFVFSNPAVVRAFDDNVIAVKVDVDQQIGMSQEYGVTSVPFDVVMMSSGRVVSKRKSPSQSSEYRRMLNNAGKILDGLAVGKHEGLKQNLDEIKHLMRTKQTKFEGQPNSFSPSAPTHNAPIASQHSTELKRKSKVIQNPFSSKPKAATPQPQPQRVVNSFQRPANSRSRKPHMSISNDIAKSKDFVAPKQPVARFPKRQSPPLPTIIPPGQLANRKSLAVSKSSTNDFQLRTPIKKSPAVDFQPVRNELVATATPPLPTNIALRQSASTLVPQTKPKKTPRQTKRPSNLTQQKTPPFIAQAKIVPQPEREKPTPGQTVNQGQAKITGSYDAKIKLLREQQAANVTGAPHAIRNRTARASATIVDNSSNQPNATARINIPSKQHGIQTKPQTPASPKFALEGKCPVSLVKQSQWVDGDQRWGCVHRNQTYIFASKANLEIFQQDPDGYSPILAGYDPVLLSETGKLVPGNVANGVFMGEPSNQRVVLFVSPETRTKFQSQPKQYLQTVRQAMQSSGGAAPTMKR